jgi:CDP-glycerol glycerophosphotransferase (TagB/SpsB family)
MEKVCFKSMGGGSKDQMKANADEHFEALKQIIPQVKRLMLFDFDNSQSAFHPPATNPSLAEWKRKNIENYLLVPDAWKRAALRLLDASDTPLFAQPALQKINDFFAEQNLTLPPGKTWRTVVANVFAVVDGKQILFENDDSLFHRIEGGSPAIKLIREEVAMSMTVDEIHEDVHQFIAKLVELTSCDVAGSKSAPLGHTSV